MDTILQTRQLSHIGTLKMLSAALAEADKIGQPQCIVIVDASGEVLLKFRMTGAKFLSLKSAYGKAVTAASFNRPTDEFPDEVKPKVAAATGGLAAGLAGGLPIRIGQFLVGGIGVGSGTQDQDVQVAKAALAAIEAETAF